MTESRIGGWGAVAMLGALACASTSHAALVVAQGNTPVTVTFDETLSGVNEGPFAGLGFSPTPAAGQLNSSAWSISGVGTGVPFGGSAGGGLLGRGTSGGGVTTVGLYAFSVGDNLILGVQPGASDFTPGSITLRVLNATGQLVTLWNLAYDIFVYNDQLRGNSLNFSHSADNASYTSVTELDFVTPVERDATPTWESVSRSLQLEQAVEDGDFLYLRWTGDDLLGGGSRDEYGIDNIRIAALLASDPPVDPPTDPPGPPTVPEPSSGVICSLLALLGLALARWTRRSHVAPRPSA